jgi:hypothetical protein
VGEDFGIQDSIFIIQYSPFSFRSFLSWDATAPPDVSQHGCSKSVALLLRPGRSLQSHIRRTFLAAFCRASLACVRHSREEKGTGSRRAVWRVPVPFSVPLHAPRAHPSVCGGPFTIHHPRFTPHNPRRPPGPDDDYYFYAFYSFHNPSQTCGRICVTERRTHRVHPAHSTHSAHRAHKHPKVMVDLSLDSEI